MIIFDSNVWIALLNTNDSCHSQAVQWFTQEVEVMVPEYVLLEVTTVLAQRVGEDYVKKFLLTLEEQPSVSISYTGEPLAKRLLRHYQTVMVPGLSYVDHALVYLSDLYPIYTFDKRLRETILRGGGQVGE